MKDPLRDNLNLQVPVKILHSALEAFLREQMQGEKIGTDDNANASSYAEILDLHLASSTMEGYDLAVDVKFKTLTTLFRNKEGSILLDVAIHFDREAQLLTVEKYKLDVDSSSWFLNNSLEALAGAFFREKIKKKMCFDFRPLIQEQLGKINQMLETSLEPTKGVLLSGFLTNFRIIDLLPGEKVLLAIVEVEGKALVEVREIKV